MQEKLPGYKEIYNDNIKKKKELNDLNDEAIQKLQGLQKETDEVEKLAEQLDDGVEQRDDLLRQLEEFRKNQMVRKLINRMSRFIILIKYRGLEGDADNLKKTMEELKNMQKKESNMNATKQSQVEKTKKQVENALRDQNVLKNQLKDEQDKREVRDIKKNEQELQYNQFKKDLQNVLKKRDNKANELKMKQNEKQEKEKAIQAQKERLKQDLSELQKELDATKDKYDKLDKELAGKKTKYEKDKKQLDFYKFLTQQKKDALKQTNDDLLKEQDDLEDQLKQSNSLNTQLMVQKMAIGKKKKKNNEKSNQIEDLTMQLAKLAKERDKNNDKNRLKELESELKKVKDEQTKATNGIDNMGKNIVKNNELFSEETEKEKKLKKQIDEMQDKIGAKTKQSEDELKLIQQNIEDFKKDIIDLEKELKQITEKNSQLLKEAQKVNIDQRNSHDELIQQMKQDYENWRVENDPKIKPLREFFNNNLNVIEEKHRIMKQTEKEIEPKQEKFKKLMAEMLKKRFDFVNSQNQHNENLQSSKFLLRQLKSKTDERRLEIIKLYVELMAIDQVKDKDKLQNEQAEFLNEWRDKSKVQDQSRFELRDFNKEVIKTREQLFAEVQKLTNEVTVMKNKIGLND